VKSIRCFGGFFRRQATIDRDMGNHFSDFFFTKTAQVIKFWLKVNIASDSWELGIGN